MKCTICKNEITTNDYIQEQIKVKGELQFYKNGSGKFRHTHTSCKENLEKEKQEWDTLYGYIKKTFFNNREVPPYMCSEIKKLRGYYSHKDMLDCLQSIEDNLLRNMMYKEFVGQQKQRYIMVALRNSIDSFVDKREIAVSNTVVSEVQFISKAVRQEDGINFDILD